MRSGGLCVANAMGGVFTAMPLSPSPAHTPPDAAPIQLQDHDSPVSFRNIWVRPLAGAPSEK